MEEIYKLIDELPMMSKTVFNLFVIDGFSHKEIANQLGISENTSKWHVSFARQKLQEKINVIAQKDNIKR